MVSALATQLQQLREAGAGSKRRTDTFLYDEREAARLDDETIYNLAWKGLAELKDVAAQFDVVDTNSDVAALFSRQRIHFYRAHLSKPETAALNTALATVLDALSGYFLYPPAHPVYEFLVRRYEIHRYNVDAILGSLLAYHESSWFIRMVRILHLRNTRWEFLLPIKTHGTPLLRSALVQRTISDPSVVEFLFTTTSRLRASHPKLTSLYTLLVLELLDKTKVTDSMLRWLAPQVLAALQSVDYPEFQAAGSMLVTKLASKAHLTTHLLDVVVTSLLKFAPKGAHGNVLLCIVFLAQSQPSFHLSRTTGMLLLAMDHVVDLIYEASAKYEVHGLVEKMLLFVTENTVEEHFHVFQALLTQLSLTNQVVAKVVKQVVHTAQKHALQVDSTSVQTLMQCLAALSRHNARQVDATITDVLVAAKQAPQLLEFVTKTFQHVPLSTHCVVPDSSTTSLAQALDHPNETICYHALETLAGFSKQEQEATHGEMLLRRIVDDRKQLVLFVLQSALSEWLLHLNDLKTVLKTVVHALDKWQNAKDWTLVNALLTFLMTKYRVETAGGETDKQLLTILLSIACKSNFEADEEALGRVWQWLEALDHPFTRALKHTNEAKTRILLVKTFGHVLAKNVKTLLPECLTWQNQTVLTDLVVEILIAANHQLASEKKKETEQKMLLTALQTLLNHEFAALWHFNDSEATKTRALTYATQLARLIHAQWALSRPNVVQCVRLLLECPRWLFTHLQETLITVFQADFSSKFVPIMTQIITKLSKQEDELVVLAKTRALELVWAVVEGVDDENSMVQVVLAALVTLLDGSQLVRQAGVTWLTRWCEKCSCTKKKTSKMLFQATRFFLAKKEEIIMDESSIVALWGLYEEEKESGPFFDFILTCVMKTSTEKDDAMAGALLMLLKPIVDTTLWLKSVDFFVETLEKTTVECETMNNVLLQLLGQYLDPRVAIQGTKSGKTTVPRAFLECVLMVLRGDKKKGTLQLFVAENLALQVYEALEDVARRELVRQLLELWLKAEETQVGASGMACLKRLPLESGVLGGLLQEQAARQVKDYVYLSGLLELVTVKVETYPDEEKHEVLRVLSEVLAWFSEKIEKEKEEEEDEEVEYVVQVLFNCMRACCQGNTVRIQLKSNKLVDHTLAWLQQSASVQTRQDGIVFLSALVAVDPKSVLQSLDTIFRLWSTGSRRLLDAEYSFHVLETILEAVGPHIKSMGRKHWPGFLQLLVDLVPCLGLEKGERVLKNATILLGHEALGYCVVAVVQNALQVKDTEQEQIELAHRVCLALESPEQVAALEMLLRMARTLVAFVREDAETDTEELEDEEEEEKEKESLTSVFSDRIVQSRKCARQLNVTLVEFIRTHLRTRAFHYTILSYEKQQKDREDRDDALQRQYLRLAQVDLLYFRRVVREERAVSDDTGFWSTLARECLDLLGALQELLSTPGFLALISELLHHENKLIRQKAMQLFNDRLETDRESLSRSEMQLFIDMLDELDIILQDVETSETTVNLQTALLSVDILARHFAAKDPARFQQILPTIVKYVDHLVVPCSAQALHLVGCAFVCLSSIGRALGPAVFPYLPTFFPNLLTGIDYCSSTKGTVSVLECLLAALEVFTDKIPQFLTPYLTPLFRTLLTPRLVSPGNGAVVLSVDCCFLNLCHHVELRHLLPSFFGVYEHVLTLQSDASVARFFGVVGTLVNELETRSVRKHLPAFARFFVTALDIRRVHASKLENVDKIEDEILDCLVQFILKLSEKQLKPLFLKLTEWTQVRMDGAGKLGDLSRRITFVKLLIQLAERLRGIFVPYYVHVLEFLTACLNESQKVLAQKPGRGETDSDDEDDFFATDVEPVRKKAKVMTSSSESERIPYTLLLTSVVRALDGCFVHDTDGFMEKERFDMVLTPLVDVFDVLRYDGSMREFVLESVTHCLANLAWAAKSDLLWKPLHYAVLMKSRQESAAVRLAALVTVEKCYQVIGDEFLAMLPESIPFLAELMEDTNDEVEKTCHRVIKQIEDISGESLDQYLTT